MKLQPVHLDGALYVAGAMLTVLIAEGHAVTHEQLAAWTWIDYSLFFATIILAGVISLKTFRSESVAWHRKNVKIEEAKESVDGVTSSEITTKQTETETVVTKSEPPDETSR